MQKRITLHDLKRYVHNLNTLHNRDAGDAGFIKIEGWCNFYISIATIHGYIRLTDTGKPRDVISELKRKCWPVVLRMANYESNRFSQEKHCR